MSKFRTKLERVAKQSRQKYIEESDFDLDHPDCHDVSVAVKRNLRHTDVGNECEMAVVEYHIRDEFHHYALTVQSPTSEEPFVVDGLYGQFDDADSDVLVVPRSEYPFEQFRTPPMDDKEDSDAPQLQTESPYGETPDQDVSCAWCGAYRTLYGPLNMDGEIVKHGDFVCGPCAKKEGVAINE